MKTLFLIPLLWGLGALWLSGQSPGKSRPLQAQEPLVWLRADHLPPDSDRSWPNSSERLADAQFNSPEGSLDLQPGAINFNDAVGLEGETAALSLAFNPEKYSNYTFMAVFRPQGEEEQMIWANENGAVRDMFLSTARVSGPDGIRHLIAENPTAPMLVSVIQLWGQPDDDPETSGEMILGAAGRQRTGMGHFDGQLAEFLVFNTSLSNAAKNRFESYLAIKYGISLRGDYTSSLGKQLWDSEKDADFGHRIAGLGRDDAFELNQKQSATSQEAPLLTISLGEVAETNALNSRSLADQQFLLFGDDGEALTPAANTSAPLPIYDRRWKLRASGEGISQLATHLYLNTNLLPAPGDAPSVLVIDRSGTGKFPAGQVAYMEGTRTAGDSMVVFRDVIWDSDGSGSDVFALATLSGLTLIATPTQIPDCQNGNGGAIDIRVLGGTPPIQYSLHQHGEFQPTVWQTDLQTSPSGLTGGHYTVAISDANGDEARTDVELPSPVGFSLDLGEDRAFVTGDAITLDLSGQIPADEGIELLWEGSNGFRSTSPKVELKEAGQYDLTLTTAEGCKMKESILLTGSDILQFDVYPSVISLGQTPRIDIALGHAAEVELRITDASGKVLHTWSAEGKKVYSFEQALRTNGTHFVELITGEQKQTRKVVVAE